MKPFYGVLRGPGVGGWSDLRLEITPGSFYTIYRLGPYAGF